VIYDYSIDILAYIVDFNCF